MNLDNLRRPRPPLEWHRVPGFPFQVSADGDVATLDGEIVQPRLDSWDLEYLRVRLLRDGRNLSLYVHLLVALAFLGPRPSKYEIDHINRETVDNRASNLRYVPKSANSRNTARVPGKKLTPAMVREIRWLYHSRRWSPVGIARFFPVFPIGIRAVLWGRTWAHVSDQGPMTNRAGQRPRGRRRGSV